MQITPGTAGLDTAAILTARAVHDAVGAGRLVFYRYVGRNGGMDANEARMIRANGGTPASVYESSGYTGDQGYNMGAIEMGKLVAGHFAAGGPKGVVLYLGAFDRDGCNGQQGQPYINGAADYAHNNGVGAGIYGPFGLALATNRWDGWWQTMSSGFCGNAQTSRATLSQHFPYEYPGGIECDGNTIHDPVHCGAWDGAVAVTPAAPPRSSAPIVLGRR